MKRTDITELFPEASAEAIDKLMAINGADINKAKGDSDSLSGQLKTAQTELEKLRAASAGQPDQLKEAADSIKRLEAELNSMKAAETTRTMREKVSAEKRIPANLLTGDTEEACAAQADAILSFAKSNGSGYPAPRDGGEIGKAAALSPRDQFAEWAKDNF